MSELFRRHTDGYYTIVEAAKVIGISAAKLCRNMKSGHVIKPSHQYGHSVRLYYRTDEVTKLKKIFDKQKVYKGLIFGGKRLEEDK